MSEKTPLITKPAAVPEDDETAASLRARTTTSYTTIALVSALLAGVSFLAYATPPAVLFSAAGGSAASAATAAPQQNGNHHEPSKSQVLSGLVEARAIVYQILFMVYGIGAGRARLPAARQGLGGMQAAVECSPAGTLHAPPPPGAGAPSCSWARRTRRAGLLPGPPLHMRRDDAPRCCASY